MQLRDHNEPCEHGFKAWGEHSYPRRGVVDPECPGGRLVQINYEAAADQLGLIDWLELQNRHPSSIEMPPYSWLKSEASAVIDAALGIEQETP